MDTALSINEIHGGVPCCAPKIGKQLPEYIVDLLDDATAAEVETHLVDCLHCKKFYLMVLRIRAARRKFPH